MFRMNTHTLSLTQHAHTHSFSLSLSLSLPHSYTHSYTAVSTPEAIHTISSSVQKASRPKKTKTSYPQTTFIPTRAHFTARTQLGTSTSAKEKPVELVNQVTTTGTLTASPVPSQKNPLAHKSHTSPKREPVSTPLKSIQGASSGHSVGSSARRSAKPSKKREMTHRVRGPSQTYLKSSRDTQRTPAPATNTLVAQSTPTRSPAHLLDSMPRAHDILASQVLYMCVHVCRTCVYVYTSVFSPGNFSITGRYTFTPKAH